MQKRTAAEGQHETPETAARITKDGRAYVEVGALYAAIQGVHSEKFLLGSHCSDYAKALVDVRYAIESIR